MKQCHQCKEVKPLEAFSPHKKHVNGRASYCKECRARNQALYRAKYPEKKHMYDEQWRVKRKQHKQEYDKKWFQQHEEKRTEYSRKYEERKQSNGGSFTKEEFQELCVFYGNKCVRCGGNALLQADHIVPVSKGGTNNIDNIQPLCATCNRKKNTKTTDYRPYVYVPRR